MTFAALAAVAAAVLAAHGAAINDHRTYHCGPAGTIKNVKVVELHSVITGAVLRYVDARTWYAQPTHPTVVWWLDCH